MMNLFKTKYLAKISVISLLLLTIATNVSACDICGCFMGLTPYDNQSNFGFLYRYRSFSGYRGQKHYIFPKGSDFLLPINQKTSATTSHNGNPQDYELYRTAEVRGRYFIHKRLEINTIIPYNVNSERYNGVTNSISGIGDVNLYAGYHLLRKLNDPTLKQRLIVGSGIKLPTGKNSIADQNGIKSATLMQPGTGSTDGFIYANYLIGYKNYGISINSSYKINGQNSDNESIANSSTSFINFFYTQKLNKEWQVTPSLQFFHEYSAGQKYNNVQTGEHKMNNVMYGIGADLYYKNISFNVGMQKNMWEANTEHPQSSAKIYLGITYNINQLYYLIKS